MDWFLLSKERQQTIIEQTAARTGNLPIVIEKDIWVCIVLKVLFESEIKDYILFKGGTSLSKGYDIIRRFSEDIDICLDKSFLGFNEPLSNTQIDKFTAARTKVETEGNQRITRESTNLESNAQKEVLTNLDLK